jgi:hypothetical protein
MPKKDPILSALEKQTKVISELAKAVAKLNDAPYPNMQALAEKLELNKNSHLRQFNSMPTLEVANGQFEPLPPADNAEKVSVSLEEMETTTGQLPPEQTVASDEVSREELERALNINQTNIFGTTDFDTFKAKLNDMTYASMQVLAEKLGLNKFATPPILKKDLEESFWAKNAAAGSMNKMPKPFVRPPLNPSSPEDRRAMEALGMKF